MFFHHTTESVSVKSAQKNLLHVRALKNPPPVIYVFHLALSGARRHKESSSFTNSHKISAKTTETGLE